MKKLSSLQVDSALNDFKSSDPTFEKCIHKALGNIFVVAFQVEVEKIGLYKCAQCGRMLRTEEDLKFHESLRLLHNLRYY
jgi:hypothetical protein